jgi:hypothetical protein
MIKIDEKLPVRNVLRFLIPVGRTMIVVAHVKYACVSTSIPTVVTFFL